ncbi:MAG: hypothetical protein ACYC6Q_07705 [Syntrophales bacterium]
MIIDMGKRISNSFDRQAIMKTTGASIAEAKGGQTPIGEKASGLTD